MIQIWPDAEYETKVKNYIHGGEQFYKFFIDLKGRGLPSEIVTIT